MDLDTLEQGNVLRIPVLPLIDKDPETGEPAITEVDTPAGMCIVVTQTCDAIREITIEPYLQVAPLRDADEALWRRSRGGRLSPRYFAIPKGIAEMVWPVPPQHVLRVARAPLRPLRLR